MCGRLFQCLCDLSKTTANRTYDATAFLHTVLWCIYGSRRFLSSFLMMFCAGPRRSEPPWPHAQPSVLQCSFRRGCSFAPLVLRVWLVRAVCIRREYGGPPKKSWLFFPFCNDADQLVTVGLRLLFPPFNSLDFTSNKWLCFITYAKVCNSKSWLLFSLPVIRKIPPKWEFIEATSQWNKWSLQLSQVLAIWRVAVSCEPLLFLVDMDVPFIVRLSLALFCRVAR